MSQIYYKFKSAKDFDIYRFEGAGVPVWELKREIINAKKLNKCTDFDLILTNSQNMEDYSDETIIIPKNSKIVVKRLPALMVKRYGSGASSLNAASYQQARQNSSLMRPQVSFFSKSNNTSATVSIPNTSVMTDEDSRIQAMMQATNTHWTANQQEMPLQMNNGVRKNFRPPMMLNKGGGPMMPTTPPESYICFRCGQKGHFIQFCPTNTDPNYDRTRIRKTTGIPKSFLKPADTASTMNTDKDSNFLVTPDGQLVIATPNDSEWHRLTALKSLSERIARIPLDHIPSDLKCPLNDGHLLKNAVKVSCCGNNFCDECVQKILDSAPYSASGEILADCPGCHTKGFSTEKISLDVEVRGKVNQFLDKMNIPNNDNMEEGETVGGDLSSSLGQKMFPLPPGLPPIPPPHFPFFFPPIPPPAAPHIPPPPFPPNSRERSPDRRV